MLEPYRVLDLTDERGMLCGQILADLGADVVAVEPPGGSPARRLWRSVAADGVREGGAQGPDDAGLVWRAYARGKRSIALDLEREEDRERLRALAAEADFLLESFPPGHMDRLGLGYVALASINPRLVMVSISPFGQSGPKANWAATDLTAWAASGTLLLTGDDDRPPVQVPGMQAWLHAGAEGAVGALIAHHAVLRGEAGRHVDVSAQAASMMATQSFILNAAWNNAPITRTGGGLKTDTPIGELKFRFVYPCKDGYVNFTFLFGNVIGPFTRRMFEWMHDEGYVDAATRDKDWNAYLTVLLTGEEPPSELTRCADAIARFTMTRTKAELFEEGLRRRVLIVPVSTVEDLANSQQLAARDFWTPVAEEGQGNPVPYPGPFARFSATPIRYRRPAPHPGEHTEEVLADLRGTGQSAMGSRDAAPPLPIADSRLPLDGLKVLDLSWVFATPVGIRYLADYGATVVHVESATRPDTLRGGGPFKDMVVAAERSGNYSNAQANKLGLSLNLTTEEARDVVRRLVQWADVVAESFATGAMKRWGLDYESLRQVRPDLIMLSSNLNGQTGPLATLAGFGTMGAQLAGFGDIVGWPDRPPAGPYLAYTDYVTPKYVASSLLAALEHRRQTGEGQHIDLSQGECSAHFLAPALLDYFINGRVLERAGNASPDMAPHGVYPCAGTDRWVAIACETEEQWRALCDAAGRPDWCGDARFAMLPDRLRHREALDTLIGAWTADKDVEQIERTLLDVRVPAHRAASDADALADPQLQARGHFGTVEHPELGPVVLEAPRIQLSRCEAGVRLAGPTFGQHNDLVLREFLGLSDDDIVQLVVAGALE